MVHLLHGKERALHLFLSTDTEEPLLCRAGRCFHFTIRLPMLDTIGGRVSQLTSPLQPLPMCSINVDCAILPCRCFLSINMRVRACTDR
ncbi:hypothetical protein BAUCODRAFT_446410 [Baudoinia panamericana UAMH 10762]|uniref:Uncharacterized protein n=1 Tax=Baudoinia panamericana (strain UAMH 10762) TaxID=717646 RepID=M2NEC2_BAUPA|nr:uncharacterized protein BAUCODRAFT_446410 [Baudoinia panamericana UAMH 10762]EMC97305.1 hypothetical protein BAUCODRAFT_446410 [Baudoinia panamericana UAMH 10762]